MDSRIIGAAQITIQLDHETAGLVEAAVWQTKIFQSQWIADAIRQRLKNEWPASVRALAGAWSDFPTAEEFRKRQAIDLPRERL